MTDNNKETLKVNGMLMSTFTMELLANDAAECLLIEQEEDFLIRVLPPEQDAYSCPPDLAQLMADARTRSIDWLCISKVSRDFHPGSDFLH